MTSSSSKSAAVCLVLLAYGSAFQVNVPQVRSVAGLNAQKLALKMEATPEAAGDRRQFLKSSAAIAVSGITYAGLSGVATADEEEVALSRTKLGGLLEPYSDISKGFKMYRPAGWNQFEGVAGQYDIKFQDIVNPTEIVLVTTTPVKSDTKLDTLGAVQDVGTKLAKSRNMELVNARERTTEGLKFYDFEFKGQRMREVRTLSVQKGKLWSLSASTPERQWGRREQTYKTVQTSFLPKL